MTDQQQPLVSVVIPAYNASKYIVQAVDSALNQTYTHVEVIVVDDGSTDATLVILRQHYADDARVRVVTQTNAGPAPARNRGIQEARGEFVHFLDADEILLPEKIEKSLALIAGNPDANVVYGHGTPVHEDGVTEIPMQYPSLPSGTVFCDWINGTMSGGTYGVTSSVMVRKSALEEAGEFDGYFSPAEDWDMWLRLALRNRFAALDDRLVVYRRMDTGIHANRLKMALARLRVYEKACDYQREWVRMGNAPCISEPDYDRLLAGRWHLVAQRYWENGQRREARHAFDKAMAYHPQQATRHRVFKLMTYVLPASAVDMLSRFRKAITTFR